MKNMMVVAGTAMAALIAGQQNRIFGFDNIRRYIRSQKSNYTKGASNSIAQRNRWTGQPHEHKREIARNQRRAAR